MQDVALIRPGRTAETELALQSEKSALRREFEERLGAWHAGIPVARGGVHNAADVEDVAQEACWGAGASNDCGIGRAFGHGWCG
jgi:hypothetical protein